MAGVQKRCILRLEHISKSFTSTKALVDVCLDVYKGEIRGLIGENGSGKSTLMNIVSGMLQADEGQMILHDKAYKPKTSQEAKRNKIAILVQEAGTIDCLTVAENIFIGHEEAFRHRGLISGNEMNRVAGELLKEMGLDGIRPDALAGSVSYEDRKFVEVAAALYNDPELVIFDETTTALSQKGRQYIYKLARRMKSEGKSVVFISHDLAEVMDICDAVSVLKDGHHVADLTKEEMSVECIRELMVGREMTAHYYREDYGDSVAIDPVLELDNICLGKILSNISLTLNRGEILGIGGLSECGMHELCHVIYGAVRPDCGEVLLVKKNLTIHNTREAILNGMGYLSKNRDRESLMLNASIRHNITLSALDIIRNGIYISNRNEKRKAQGIADQLSIKMWDIDQTVLFLSGGNKQKVALGKLLAANVDIFILDCPTRGIDIGVKSAIYDMMYDMKRAGKSIIMVSEELTELIGMSDRIVTIKDGCLTGEFIRGKELGERDIIQRII